MDAFDAGEFFAQTLQVGQVVYVEFDGAFEDAVRGFEENLGHVDGHLVGDNFSHLTYQADVVDTP